MWKNSFPGLGISLPIFVLCWAAWTSWAQPPVLPQEVTNAHTVLIQNDTGFAEMEYTAILELNKWGHFEMAASRDKADLILRLDTGTRVRLLREGAYVPPAASETNESPVPPGYTRIALLQPKTGRTLWWSKHKTEGSKVKSGHLLDELREAFRDYERGKN